MTAGSTVPKNKPEEGRPEGDAQRHHGGGQGEGGEQHLPGRAVGAGAVAAARYWEQTMKCPRWPGRKRGRAPGC